MERLEQEQGSSEKIQQLLSITMAETSKLRSENDRLRMLEHQPITQAAESPKDFEDIKEDIIEGVDPVIAETAKSSGWTWPVLTMGILAVGCWVVLQISPESQLRIAELVKW